MYVYFRGKKNTHGIKKIGMEKTSNLIKRKYNNAFYYILFIFTWARNS